MNEVHHRQAGAKLCPSHARLIEQAAEVRRIAAAFVRSHRRHGYVRPGSAENIFLNAVAWSLEHADLLYGIAARGEGTLVLDVDRGPDGFGRPRLILRPPPAKVIDMAAFRERRAAMGA